MTPSLWWTRDPETADQVAAALLTALLEQHGPALGPTVVAALRHAIRNLTEL